MINMMIDAIPTFEGFLSDMYVFKKLVETDKNAVGIIYEPEIFTSRKGFSNYVEQGILDCENLKNQKAIHLSHHRTKESFALGVYPLQTKSPIQERGKAAAILMKDYENQCIKNNSS